MMEVWQNMDLAEHGIVFVALAIGFLIGCVFLKIKTWMKDRKFDSEEREISKQLHRMSVDKIRKLSEDGKFRIDPSMKILLEKIAHEIGGIKTENRDTEDIEEDIDNVVSFVQQLAYA